MKTKITNCWNKTKEQIEEQIEEIQENFEEAVENVQELIELKKIIKALKINFN